MSIIALSVQQNTAVLLLHHIVVRASALTATGRRSRSRSTAARPLVDIDVATYQVYDRGGHDEKKAAREVRSDTNGQRGTSTP